MMLKNSFWLAQVAIATLACSSDPVDIGDTGKTGDELSDYAASWEGYAEAYEFDSASDALRIVLDENGNGTFEVGDAPALPPPSDPEVGYPPAGTSSQTNPQPADGLFSGFAYTVLGATVEERRLRFSVYPYEIYREWCELQTPVLDEANSTPERSFYECVPNTQQTYRAGQCTFVNPDTGEDEPIDCGKLGLCSTGGACYCTANDCSIPDVSEYRGAIVEVDAALEEDGDELEGTLTVDGNVTIRLTRR